MRCETAYGLIQDFIDGLLPEGERQRVESHLHTCERCASEAREYKLMQSALDEGLAHEPVPAGFADGIISSLRASGRIAEQKRRGLSWVPAPLRVPLAAAAVLLIAVALFPVTVNILEAMVGKGTVLVVDTYIDIQEKATDVSLFTKLAATVQKTLRTLKTVVVAAASLIATAGHLFKIPATAMLIAIVGGIYLYFRALRRRTTHHVSLSM